CAQRFWPSLWLENARTPKNAPTPSATRLAPPTTTAAVLRELPPPPSPVGAPWRRSAAGGRAERGGGATRATFAAGAGAGAGLAGGGPSAAAAAWRFFRSSISWMYPSTTARWSPDRLRTCRRYSRKALIALSGSPRFW